MGKELSRIVLVVLVVALSSMLALPGSARAANKPHLSFYGNVAVVATSGGDYADPASAMADYSSWCGTPSATSPCLLKIMPGVYTVTSPVVMQPYIDIEGSGEMVTKITGALNGQYPSTTPTLEGASHAELRFVTVENTGTSGYTTAISNSSQSPSILHVTASASGGTDNYGVFNTYASPTMTNVTATASGGTESFGVFNRYASPTMTNVTATASGGTNSNYGVFNVNSSLTMTNVTATASGGSFSYGVYNSNSGTVKIDHSVIKGSTNSIFCGGGTATYVGDSQLDGSAGSAAGGTLTCVGAYDGSYVALSTTCGP